MNFSNETFFDGNESFISPFELTNPCPRQRNITRPLLSIHNYALFLFGSIFNFLAFVILMQRSLRCHSTFAYLAFLSLSNGLLSLVHFSKWMFKYYFNILFESYLITCRFNRFSSDFLTHFSLYTLIFVNIDRARTVTRNRPALKYPQSRFRTVLMRELVVGLILGAFHFHWIIKYGYEVTDGPSRETRCVYDESQSSSIYFYFLNTIYPPFELIIFLCLPLLINIFCTILIVRSLNIRMRTAKQFRPARKLKKSWPVKGAELIDYFLPKTARKSNIYSCFGLQVQCRRHTKIRMKLGSTKESLLKYRQENRTIDRQTKFSLLEENGSQLLSSSAAAAVAQTSQILSKQHRTRRSRDLHLSAMLIGLNIFYLILNLPFNIYQTFAKHFYTQHSDPCDIMFIGVLLDALQQTFFYTNFFLYVLTNRRFREEFYNTFRRFVPRNPTLITNGNASNQSRVLQSSFNVSTMNFRDNQITSVSTPNNRESVNSVEVELSSIVQPHRHGSKLVMFRGSLTDQHRCRCSSQL